VWGTKYAIASVRSPQTNHRVILGISHFDATATGGEGRIFTDLATDLTDRTSGIHAFTAASRPFVTATWAKRRE